MTQCILAHPDTGHIQFILPCGIDDLPDSVARFGDWFETTDDTVSQDTHSVVFSRGAPVLVNRPSKVAIEFTRSEAFFKLKKMITQHRAKVIDDDPNQVRIHLELWIEANHFLRNEYNESLFSPGVFPVLAETAGVDFDDASKAAFSLMETAAFDVLAARQNCARTHADGIRKRTKTLLKYAQSIEQIEQVLNNCKCCLEEIAHA